MTKSLDLKQLRLNTGLRRKEFCYKLGIGERSLRYWEAGQRIVPTQRIVNYARVCGVSQEEILKAIGETFDKVAAESSKS